MAQGKRFHLSYERLALLVNGAPGHTSSVYMNPLVMDRIQGLSYSFDYNAQQLSEIGSNEYIKNRKSTDTSRSQYRIPIVSQPTVNLQFEYLLFDGGNEKRLGLSVGLETWVLKTDSSVVISSADHAALTNIDPNDSTIPRANWDKSAYETNSISSLLNDSPLYNTPDWSNSPGAVAPTGDVTFFALAEGGSNRKDTFARAVKVESNVAKSGTYFYDPALQYWKLGEVSPSSLNAYDSTNTYSSGQRVSHNSGSWEKVGSAQSAPAIGDDWVDVTLYTLEHSSNNWLLKKGDVVADSFDIPYVLKTDFSTEITSSAYDALAAAEQGLYAEKKQPLSGVMENGTSISYPFSGMDVLGFGNCYLTNYSIGASLGGFLSCKASYACSNLSFDLYDPADPSLSPSVDKQGSRSTSRLFVSETSLAQAYEGFDSLKTETLALAPGDIIIKVINNKPDGGFTLIDLNAEDMSIQSVQIGLPIKRQDIKGLGSNYIKDRKIQFPLLGSVSLTVLARDFDRRAADYSIKNIFQNDVDCDIEMVLRTRTGLGSRSRKLKVNVVNAKLNSESHSFGVGGFAQISAEFVFEVTPEFGLSLNEEQ
jgi:hypothetical protein